MTHYANAAAKLLASYGRHGDDVLVHMSKEELRELSKLGTLTINPETGLPEAFSLGGVIRSLAGPAAGILTGNPWIGAAVGGAAGGFGGGGGFNPVGALTGGLGGYFGTEFGQGVINNGIGPTLSNVGSSIGDWANGLWSGGGGAATPGFSGLTPPVGSDMFSAGSGSIFDPDYLRKAYQIGGGFDLTGGMGTPPFASGNINLPSSPVAAASPNYFARAANTLSSVGSGLYALNMAGNVRGMSNNMMSRADPWGTSGGRGVADAQLQALLRDPSGTAANDPAFQLRLQAAMRANAPMGTDSGAMAKAAADASTTWYNERLQQLGGISGAGVNPASAAELMLQGNMGANQLAGQGLASIGYGINTATGGTAGAAIPESVRQWLRTMGVGA